MPKKILAPVLMLTLGHTLTAPLLAQTRTEIRDPLRGVSFHSIELSDVAVNTLDVLEGSFADSDRLAIGLSALVLDGSDNADEHILWLRHEGRRWLDFRMDDAISIEVDGTPLPLERLRASQPFVGQATRLFEKIEFSISESELDRLSGGSDVVIRLKAKEGVVHKRVTEAELEHLREFQRSIARGS